MNGLTFVTVREDNGAWTTFNLADITCYGYDGASTYFIQVRNQQPTKVGTDTMLALIDATEVAAKHFDLTPSKAKRVPKS